MDKRKLIVLILCFVCISHLSSQAQEITNDGIIPLTAIEKEYLANNPIKMCVDPDWLPYEQLDENKNHIGMIADYYKLIQKAIGKQIQVIPTASWKETLNNVRIRKCDIVSTAAITEERKEYVTFTKPYMVSPIVIATRNNEVYISNLEEVLDKTFAAIKDYSHINLLREKYPSIKIIEVNNVVTGLEKVSNGEVYGFMDAIPSIAYEIQRNSFFNLKISGSTGLTYDLSIAVRNDDPILLGIMQKAIDSISSQKQEEIANKWISVNYVYGFDYSLLWKIIIIGSLLLISLLYWNNRLKKEILERKNAESALLQSEERLNKSNQQLEANNQQLIATEQQLRAGNQQLDAMNQQLSANAQQLRATNQMLIDSEKKFRSYIENAPNGIFIANEKGEYLEVNQSACNITGYNKKELLTLTIADLIQKEYLEHAENHFRTLVEKGSSKGEMGYLTKTGEKRFWSIEAVKLSNTRLLGFVKDITERKKAEEKLNVLNQQLEANNQQLIATEQQLRASNQQLDAMNQQLEATNQQLIENTLALKESENRFRTIFENAPIMIDSFDKNGKCLLWNKECERVHGYTIEEINQTDDPITLFYPDKKYREKVFNSIINNPDKKFREWQVQAKDGKTIPVTWANFKISDNEVICIGIDLTENKKREKALKKSEETYRLFAENSLDVIWSTDKNYNMTFVNKAIFQLLGYTPEEVLAMHPNQYTTPESFDKIAIVAEKLLSKFELGEIGQEQIEVQQVKKDGSIIDVEFTCNILRNDKGEFIGFQGRSIDITRRNEIEKELLKMDKLKSIGTLAGGIAHDFNNILSGIFGYVSLALMKLDKDHPSHQYLAETEKSLDRATKLTGQLLTFSKGGTPIKTNVNLNRIIKETVIFDLSGSNVKPVFNFAENLHNAKVDEGQIQQVFSNLTINANQASPDGGNLYISIIKVFVRNGEISDLKSGEYLKITVQDEGTGIPQKNIDKIFDPYFTTKATGNGLGLTTTYSIIKKHKGHLEIDSKLGKGTKFTIYLPASKNEEIINEEISEIIVTPKNRSLKILIMDDEKPIREISSQMLEMLGYKADSVADGKQAITKYKEAIEQKNPFDLIIMDLTIPGGMGGKETVKKILEIDNNAKVIVSSGYSSGAELADYKSYGFIERIDKPYTMPKLKEVLHRVLSDDLS